MEFIKRNYPAEFHSRANDGLIEGTPIVFNTPTDIGGWFQETICAGAISEETLKNDVRFFWNHDLDKMAVARSTIPIDKLGGMEFTIDENGVQMLMNPNRKRSDANDLCLAIEDGVINAMSFMFRVKRERWEDLDTDYPKRFIEEIDPIIEVSAVNFPAYSSTEIHARRDTATEIDRAALDKVQAECRAEAETEANKQRELELLKIKAKYLY